MKFKIKGKKIVKKEKDYLFALGFKWCSKCKQPKELNKFCSNSGIKDGYNAICKECSNNKRKDNVEYYKQKDAERYQNKREELIEKAAKYRFNHKEKIKTLKDKYYQENKDEILLKNEEYRQNNLDKIRQQQKDYHYKNKEYRNKSSREYGRNNRERLSEYVRNKYNNDNYYKLRCVCRELVRRMFKAINTNKNQSTHQILGYTPLELKEHIEKQFKEGMSWDNYGEWHIDHIIPISLAKTLEEGIELSKLENLQPLWAKENILKSNKTQ